MSLNINSSVPIQSSGLDLAGMDLETALLAVQGERVRLLDQQLQSQLEEVQARNDQVSKLNTLQTALNQAKLHFKADAKAEDKFSDVKINDKKATYKDGKTTVQNPEHKRIIDDINKALKEAGFDKRISTSINKGDLEKLFEDTKNAVDKESNSQQMDMLRLQSLSGKRNEAFDVMTNFVKKMQDSRSAIIANLR